MNDQEWDRLKATLESRTISAGEYLRLTALDAKYKDDISKKRRAILRLKAHNRFLRDLVLSMAGRKIRSGLIQDLKKLFEA